MSGFHASAWFSLPDVLKITAVRADLLEPGLVREVSRSATAAAPAPTTSVQPAAPSPTPTAVPATPTPSPVHEQSRSSVLAAVSGSPRQMAQALAADRGWTGAQWTCLDQLWEHETRYETTVSNPVSGAYGIPQALPASKMASAGSDWRTNPATQIEWGLGYIANRYGSPCGAWSYWLRHYSY